MPAELLKAWKALQLKQPRLRIRDAATILNVSELELALCETGAELLQHKPPKLIKGLKNCGKLMALTRNDAVVSEVKASYGELKGGAKMGLMLGDIDLRLFFTRWAFTLYIDQEARQSIQFFDQQGNALHKVFTTQDTDLTAWKCLTEKFKVAFGALNLDDLQPFAPSQTAVSKPSKDAELLRQKWSEMSDVHQFMKILSEQNLTRLQAFELAGDQFARPINRSKIDELFESVKAQNEEIMLFVNNTGLIQIFSGKVNTLKTMGPWFNVLDPDFNLHLNTDLVDQAWTSIRPSSDGDIQCIDLFDANEQPILQIFSRRKEGQAQADFWPNTITQVFNIPNFHALSAEVCA
jgi:putative hemin transport protein